MNYINSVTEENHILDNKLASMHVEVAKNKNSKNARFDEQSTVRARATQRRTAKMEARSVHLEVSLARNKETLTKLLKSVQGAYDTLKVAENISHATQFKLGIDTDVGFENAVQYMGVIESRAREICMLYEAMQQQRRIELVETRRVEAAKAKEEAIAAELALYAQSVSHLKPVNGQRGGAALHDGRHDGGVGAKKLRSRLDRGRGGGEGGGGGGGESDFAGDLFGDSGQVRVFVVLRRNI
jgi:hypothetical protein